MKFLTLILIIAIASNSFGQVTLKKIPETNSIFKVDYVRNSALEYDTVRFTLSDYDSLLLEFPELGTETNVYLYDQKEWDNSKSIEYLPLFDHVLF